MRLDRNLLGPDRASALTDWQTDVQGLEVVSGGQLSSRQRRGRRLLTVGWDIPPGRRWGRGGGGGKNRVRRRSSVGRGRPRHRGRMSRVKVRVARIALPGRTVVTVTTAACQAVPLLRQVGIALTRNTPKTGYTVPLIL